MGWGVGDCGTLEEDGELAGVGFVVGQEEVEGVVDNQHVIDGR